MIRSLSVIILGTVLAWPVAANAQRGGGGGQRGGGGRGTAARATVVAPNSRVTTVNRAPQGGALGTPGAPGPWVGGTGFAPGAAARVRQNTAAFADVGYQQVYPYPVYNGGYYGIPTFTTGFDTGYYPPGVWPSPVVTPPIYPTPYYGEQPIEAPSSPQDMILAAELARISQQLEQLRSQALQPVPQEVPQQQYPAPANTQREKPAMPTVIIMRDGQRIETQSYAVANQTLWIFDQGTTQRYSMGNVDVDATQKENSRRGMRFLVE